jgi:outer membrane protein assembly factor BamB
MLNSLKKIFIEIQKSFKFHKTKNQNGFKMKWNFTNWYNITIRGLIFFLVLNGILLSSFFLYGHIRKGDNTQLFDEKLELIWSLNITDIVNGSKWHNYYSADFLIVEDLNNDNQKDIITGIHHDEWKEKRIFETIIIALDGEDRSLLWSFSTQARVVTPPLIDVDNDNKLELVIAYKDINQNGGLCVLNAEDGSILWLNDTIGYIRDYPVVDDIDKDGFFEIICCTGETDTLSAFNAEDGSLLWSINPFNQSSDTIFDSSPAIGDINGDGEIEVVISTGKQKIFAFKGDDGSVLWSFSTNWWNPTPPVLGDINGDGLLEVVVGSGDSNLYAINGKDGSLLWSFSFGSGSSNYKSPALGDLNSDGTLDIFVSDYSKTIYAINGVNGKKLWSKKVSDTIIPTASICDINGDQKLDIVAHSRDGILYLIQGYDGFIFSEYQLDSWLTSNSNPIVAGDFDNDGSIEFLTLVDNNITNDTMLYLLDFPSEFETGYRNYWAPYGGNLQRTNNAVLIDPDQDGLSTYSENIVGSNPLLKDSDEDKLPDSYEIVWTCTNPLLIDSDNNGITDSNEDIDKDGLTNYEEYLAETDPALWDTDYDFLSDSRDPFPLFPDGYFYLSFSSVASGFFIGYFVIFLLRKKKKKSYFVCNSCGLKENDKDVVFCPSCGKKN